MLLQAVARERGIVTQSLQQLERLLVPEPTDVLTRVLHDVGHRIVPGDASAHHQGETPYRTAVLA